MDCKTTQTTKVLSSQTDFNASVGLIESCQFFQDNMCEFFYNIKCDGVRLVPTCHAFWAITKNKIRFLDDVRWLDEIDITTNLCKLSGVRLNLSSKIECGGEAKMVCLQELCAMDSDTRKLRLVNTIPQFPCDIESKEAYSDIQFDKLNFELMDNLVGEVKVNSTNIDFFGHTNNIEYVKMMYSVFPSSEIKKIKPREFEIHYLQESKEGDTLGIYRKIEENQVLFEIKKDNKTLVRAKLIFDRLI